MSDKNTSNADLKRYIEVARAERTDDFLGAFDAQTWEEEMEMTRVVLERFGTGIEWMRGAREQAAGSIENQDSLAKVFARHWITNPVDFFAQQTRIWDEQVRERFDAAMRKRFWDLKFL